MIVNKFEIVPKGNMSAEQSYVEVTGRKSRRDPDRFNDINQRWCQEALFLGEVTKLVTLNPNELLTSFIHTGLPVSFTILPAFSYQLRFRN